MKILTKYVLKEHVGPFIFAVTALTSLMLLQYIGKRLGDLVGKGLPWRVLAEFFGLSIPFTVAMTLPMAVLVAVLYAYTRMASENEITAMRATGISMRTLLAPTLVAGAAVALLMLVFNDQVLSRANHQLAVLQDDISRTKPSFALKEQVINTIVEQKFYLRAQHIDRGSQHMRGVTIWDVSNPAHRRTIYADSGTLGLAENRVDLLMHLYDGVMVEVPTAQPKQYTRMYYASDIMQMRNVTNSFTATDADSAAKSDREMTVCEMQAQFAQYDYLLQQATYDRLEAQDQILAAAGQHNIQWPAKPVRRNPFGLGKIYCAVLDRLFGVKRAEAATLPPAPHTAAQQPVAQHPPAAQAVRPPPIQAPAQRPGTAHVAPAGAMPPATHLTDAAQAQSDRLRYESQEQVAMARQKAARYERIRYDIEIQKKFSLAAACIIFVLLGPPIALRFPRGGVGLVIGVSFVVFAIYYVGLIGGETLANDQFISPFWAMWAANLVLLAIGVVMTLRMNQVSGATRGGDWSEVRALLGRWARRLTGRSAGSAA